MLSSYRSATEADKLPFFHLKPMGLCTCPAKWATGLTCLPTNLQWDNSKDGLKIMETGYHDQNRNDWHYLP